MQIKIWSAIDGSCPVTLIGHRGSVNDVCIVDRGRNIITVGRDGFAKLWSCGKQCCIEDIFNISERSNCTINCCALSAVQNVDLGKRATVVNENSNGTVDKLLAFGTEGGFVYGVGVNSHQNVNNSVL